MTAWLGAGVILVWFVTTGWCESTLYLAPTGNDAAAGDSAHPLATLSAALERSGRGGVSHLILRGGIYVLDGPLVFRPQNSGLTISAYERERPVISGRTRLTGWLRNRVNPNIWETTAPFGDFHELFVNGARRSRTRRPESGFFRMDQSPATNYPDQIRFHPGQIKKTWAGDDVELVAYQAWAQTRNVILGVKTNLAFLAGKAVANQAEHHWRFFLENVPEPPLPGQWHLDSRTRKVTYWPVAGEDVPSALITAPHLDDLINLDGTPEQPVRNITFRGMTFADVDWSLPHGSYVDVQAAFDMPAAFRARFAQHCLIDRCVFTRLGGYAVELGEGCQSNTISRCEMFDLGGGGVRIGGPIGRAPGSSLAGWNVVADNHIHDIGLVEAPAVGVLVLLSPSNRIAGNEIDHTFYTTISLGWSWGYLPNPCRGNIVEGNHLHDFGQGLLSDMGGVYTLGLQPGAIIRHNIIHDVNVSVYGGWGLYMDEGSSGILLESNLVYRCQSAGFHQHYGESNVVCHNIFALNRLSQLARTRPETHLGFIFTSNVVYGDSGTLFSGNWWNHGFYFDYNLYFDTHTNEALATFKAWKGQGNDLHSILADPLFVNPQRGDFRLRRNSPARRLGYGF